MPCSSRTQAWWKYLHDVHADEIAVCHGGTPSDRNVMSMEFLVTESNGFLDGESR